MCVQAPTTTSQLPCPSLVRLASSAGAFRGSASLRANRSGSSEASVLRAMRTSAGVRLRMKIGVPLHWTKSRLAWPNRVQIYVFNLGYRRCLLGIHVIDERPERRCAAHGDKGSRGLNHETSARRPRCHRHRHYRVCRTSRWSRSAPFWQAVYADFDLDVLGGAGLRISWGSSPKPSAA